MVFCKTGCLNFGAISNKGFKNLPGSPAFHEEQAKRLKRLRGAPTGFSAAEFGPQQPMQGPAMGPTSMGLNFDKRTGKLLRGPAGSGGGGFRNLNSGTGTSINISSDFGGIGSLQNDRAKKIESELLATNFTVSNDKGLNIVQHFLILKF